MKVSVIIPCYNERSVIKDLLDALLNQSFPVDDMEVIVADGMSTDGTREIINKFAANHPELPVKLVDNWKRTIPSALNRALEKAQGEFIVRLDAHSNPDQEYIKKSIQALEEEKGSNIGGVLAIKPSVDTWIARSIAVAAGHPLGVGDARYRIGSRAREVDTVAYGAYRADLITEIGPYDESLLANEDYEFNVRIRKAGGTIWLDPSVQADYLARATLGALASQYWRYGFWKLKMLLRYPETFRWRQISGLFVLSWIVLGLLSVWVRFARWLLALEAVIYLVPLLISGVIAAIRRKDFRYLLGVPAAIATMHFSWGAGFLWSLVTSAAAKLSGRE